MALYHGPLSALLRELNNNTDWRALVGPISKRLKDVELVLRFFALLFYRTHYQPPMKDFLNRYMAANRTLTKQSGPELTDIFAKTTSVILRTLGSNAFRPEHAINAALVDAVMVAVGTRLIHSGQVDASKLEAARAALLADAGFTDAISTGTSQKGKVDLRLTRAIAAIA